jgi:hypothetical protein
MTPFPFLKVFSILGGSSFFWKLFDEFSKRAGTPHVKFEIQETKLISQEGQNFISFDIHICNPTSKRVSLIFSRAICASLVHKINTTTIGPTDDYLDKISKISATPQSNQTPVFRHEFIQDGWAEFAFSPLGSSYSFEPGEEYRGNFCMALAPSNIDRLVMLTLQLIFCEKIPPIKLRGSPEENDISKLTGIDEWDIEYKGDFLNKFLRMNKTLYFNTQQFLPVAGKKSQEVPHTPN